MPIKTARAHPEIIRRVGLGAQQCTACGATYMDTQIPEVCSNPNCISNREIMCRPRSDNFHYGEYHLTEDQGALVADALKRYSTELHDTARRLASTGGNLPTTPEEYRVEANRIWALAKLFE